MKFKLGRIVITNGIGERMNAETAFAFFIRTCLEKYMRCDWGNTCDEDKAANDHAVKCGERILAVYNYQGSDDQIWIITEWDRSVTTILFSSEY